jgi:hypothetical protein
VSGRAEGHDPAGDIGVIAAGVHPSRAELQILEFIVDQLELESSRRLRCACLVRRPGTKPRVSSDWSLHVR